MALTAVVLLGVVLFAWPFMGLGLPASVPALTAVAASVVAVAGMEGLSRRLDSRQLALAVTLIAVDAVLRGLVVSGIEGFSPVFVVILIGGYVLGPKMGYVIGAGGLLGSAVVTGGLGPWLPYQMVGAGGVGVLAGVAGYRRREAVGSMRGDRAILAAVGVVGGYLFGFLLDIWDWTFFRGAPGLGWTPGIAAGDALGRFVRFYVSTSLVYDSFRAWGNALAVMAIGSPLILVLRRHQARCRVIVESLEASETCPHPDVRA